VLGRSNSNCARQ